MERENAKNLKEKLFLKEKDKHKGERKIKKSVKERGITLIALVITIIILLILAGVTLGTALGDNGLFQRARSAVNEYRKAEEEESQGINEIIKEMDTINGKGGEDAPGLSASKLNSQIEGGDTSALGKKVTGLQLEGLRETYEWQILDVDESHIYLIATDYIHTNDCPTGKNGTNTVVKHTTDYRNSMENVINDYEGSNDVPDAVKNLNEKFFRQLGGTQSTDNNAKAMAYMLDTDVWTAKFKERDEENKKIEYVIGGPTIEQIFKAYNKTKTPKEPPYETRVQGTTGYEISKDGTNWAKYYESMIDTKDTRFVLTSISKASFMWVASPNATNDTAFFGLGSDGGIALGALSSSNPGFRPVICLKTDVHLEEINEEYAII